MIISEAEYDKAIERVTELMCIPERSGKQDEEFDRLVRAIEFYETEILGGYDGLED